MKYLIVVTIIWAFSFSLIGEYLSGQVDSWFSVMFRVGIACLIFIPFLKLKQVSLKTIISISAIGGVQLGLMYCFYFQSFKFLTVPEVLLFSVFTPIYITIINDLLSKKFHKSYLITSLIAVLGAVYIQFTSISENVFIGFLLTQGANLCFAIGQVTYKRLLQQNPELKKISTYTIFGLFFIGAFIISFFTFVLFGSFDKLPTSIVHWSVLIYLGVIASGLGYYFWNQGVLSVNTGSLAIMNNALIPLGLLVNLIIWNKDADLVKILIGGSLIFLSLIINENIKLKHN